MGLASGLLWAPVNIDITQPGSLAASIYQYDCSFFSWGNVDGHNPTTPSSFSPWDWGNRNEQSPWYVGQVYGSTPGALLEADMPLANDIANVLFGTGWKIPSAADFTELLDNCDFVNANGVVIEGTDKRISVNGIVGVRLRSKVNGNILFLPACGYGYNNLWSRGGSNCIYWSTTWSSERSSNVLFITSSQAEVVVFDRFFGFPVRPVFDPSAI